MLRSIVSKKNNPALLAIWGLFIFVGKILSAQAPDTLWMRLYAGSVIASGHCVQQTQDGGYILCGSADGKVWLVKTDAAGDTLWTKKYIDGYGYCVKETADGGYIIAGSTTPIPNFVVIKTDNSGAVQWTKIFGQTFVGDEAYCVHQIQDSSYIVCGYTNSYGSANEDVWLIKFSPEGETLWTKRYGGPSTDRGYSFDQTQDKGYIIAGTTAVAGDFQDYLIKTDSLGNLLWTKTMGDTGIMDFARAVHQTQDSGYIIAGFSPYVGAWLRKTDSSGNLLWQKDYNPEGTVYSAQVLSNGYIICGRTEEPGDIWLGRTDLSGETLWTKTIGSPGNDEGNYVSLTSDGGYIVAGMYYGDAVLIKIAPEQSVKETLSSQTSFSLTVHPNPFTKKTEIRWQIPDNRYLIPDTRWQLKIYDATGQLVRNFPIRRQTDTSVHQFLWDGTDDSGLRLPTGVYFLHLKGLRTAEIKKIILLN